MMDNKPQSRTELRIQTSISGVLLALILVLAAFASHRYQIRWDWTASAKHSLADQSLTAVAAFEGKPLTATVYVQEKGDRRMRAQNLLEKYKAAYPDLTIRFVDPDLDPGAAKRAGVAMYGTVVMRSEEKSEKITEITEQALTNALIRLSKGSAKTLRFVQGHGERPLPAGDDPMGGRRDMKPNGYDKIAQLLKGEGYRVEPIHLAQVEEIPADTTALVVAGPEKALLPVEIERLTKWFNKDGRLLLMIDGNEPTGLEPILKERGIAFLEGIVIDPISRLFGGGPTTPLVSQYHKQHPITARMESASFFPDARAMEIKTDGDHNLDQSRINLFQGAAQGWLERGDLDSGAVEFNPEQDQKGPVTLGVAVTQDKQRLVVIGDADFAGNAYVGAVGNSDLFLNAVRWLAEDEHFIAIKPKEVLDAGLVITPFAATMLLWGLIVGIPMLLAGIGVLVWMRRKRL